MNILLACLAAAQSAQAAPIKVACFGDSVTAGTAAKGKPSVSSQFEPSHEKVQLWMTM